MFDALDRLHERLREAEESRDAVVGQVAQLRRQCQVRVKQAGEGPSIERPPSRSLTLLQRLEDELSKKREELRDLLLMPASKKALPSAATDVRRKEAPPPKGDEEDAAAAAAGPSSSVGAAVCPSPLNLSAESGIDNAERSSSVDSALSKVRPRNGRISNLLYFATFLNPQDPEDIRERMKSMEAELRTLRREIATRNEEAGNNNVGGSGAGESGQVVGDSSSSDDVGNSTCGGKIKFDQGKEDGGGPEDAEEPMSATEKSSTSEAEEAEETMRSSEKRVDDEDDQSEAKVAPAKGSGGEGGSSECVEEKVRSNNNKESKLTKRRRIK